ncbi:MAG: aminopeptidase P family protein [Theionarchaea archaeon]|nr:aminopeptidase P family protein [Theionarchaea archaeon]MBU6999768.1 aminopeptidase P family protein [Theionarchaea archaeon]MBU7020189.1 aminopeptidase P family protein [Theionarchaea archaeon]MBU7033694.1 aminopeptidase P family protein [Theionarchaea archaeon]MBU7039995.1 aminopeptidase P family protein [Theionarchaea archaeon]
MKLSSDFYQRICHKIQEALTSQSLDALLLFEPANIAYATGFFHLRTERPLAAVIPREGAPLLLIPLLEVDHVPENTEVETYFDYPGETNRIEWIKSHLKKRALVNVGIEDSLSISSYKMLSTLKIRSSNLVSEMRLKKTPEEIELISRAAEYADYAVERAVHHTRPGVTEFEINERTRMDVSERMLEELEEIVPVQGGMCGGLVGSGENGALPHGLPSSKKVKEGESIILSFGAAVGGYQAESERTGFVGSPTPEQKEAFDVMYEAQKTGERAVKAGVKCSDVNEHCLKVIRERGYEKYLRHRMGHGIGLQGHEPPWVEEGDKTILQENMVISNEPGVYMPGFGGFRHSDTVLVTETGGRALTRYPRELDSLIIS